MSLFNVGLTLFKLALESSEYIRVPFSLKLYDIWPINSDSKFKKSKILFCVQ